MVSCGKTSNCYVFPWSKCGARERKMQLKVRRSASCRVKCLTRGIARPMFYQGYRLWGNRRYHLRLNVRQSSPGRVLSRSLLDCVRHLLCSVGFTEEKTGGINGVWKKERHSRDRGMPAVYKYSLGIPSTLETQHRNREHPWDRPIRRQL